MKTIFAACALLCVSLAAAQESTWRLEGNISAGLKYYGGRWLKGGGTSAAAPLWAAFNALVNQQRATYGLGPLGFPNPTLYYLAQTARYSADFHDVIYTNISGGYPAVKGYDNITGLGSFNGANLLNDLQIDPIAIAFHVDGSYAGSLELGTPANPFKTVTTAMNAVTPNHPTLIYIKPGLLSRESTDDEQACRVGD